MKLQLAEDDRPPETLSLQEYLSRVWRPDCDFVDGRSEDRNIGEYDHSCMVMGLIKQLAVGNEPRILALPSLRMRVAPNRVRVADLCVIEPGSPHEQVLMHPPLAVFEVLSQDDRFSVFMEKLRDYQRFGIANVWVIDPEQRMALRYEAAHFRPVSSTELTVPETPVRVVLSELFASLDRK